MKTRSPSARGAPLSTWTPRPSMMLTSPRLSTRIGSENRSTTWPELSLMWLLIAGVEATNVACARAGPVVAAVAARERLEHDRALRRAVRVDVSARGEHRLAAARAGAERDEQDGGRRGQREPHRDGGGQAARRGARRARRDGRDDEARDG